MVEPRTWAKVTPLVRERIVELCGCEGREVDKGDVLARLDDREGQATDELVARHRYASRELERLRDLAARNVSTLQELERAESETAQLEALIARQRTRLESYYCARRATGSLRQDGEVGEIAEPGTGAVLGWSAAAAPDRSGGERGGHPAGPAWPAHPSELGRLPGPTAGGHRQQCDAHGRPGQQDLPRAFRLPDDTPLAIGMTVEVNIVVRVAEATLLVPAGVVEDGGVFVVEDGTAHRRAVVLGIQGATKVEVTGWPRGGRGGDRGRGSRGRGAGAGGERAMRLLLELALTHVLGRGRQTVVAGVGVALGVGFSVAMAALMQGSQDDFIRQLVDTMPHVAITDETRTPAPQPAEAVFDAASFSGLRPVDDPRGIRNPTAARVALEAWVPGRVAVSLGPKAVARYSGRDAGVAVIGIEPKVEARVNSVAGDFVLGGFEELAAGGNNIVIGDALAEKLGAGLGSTIDIVSASGRARGFRIVGLFHTGATTRDEGEAYVLLKNAQVLAERANVINEIRVRLDDPAAAREVAARAEAALGYKAVHGKRQTRR